MKELIENFYLLRNTYQKIEEFNKESINEKIDLDRMIWGKDIYKFEFKNLVELKKTYNWTLYELEYKSYRLFFISEFNSTKGLTNVFWVNILKRGTIYEKYKNESIISYKQGDRDSNFEINLNNQIFTVAYIGNSLVSYCKKNKYSLSYLAEIVFKDDVSNYLYGSAVNYKFKSSMFNNYIIVYGHDY
ncbi:hypothetical protein B0H99_103288 [Planomicrobium soli]|uniref:Uncharacterized protein n=1 Tax=Planomicrobium soli TaxID=1176648 RepID=A0A2P8H4K8_9BACL|nr:hypothetical protein [Planomicrobium soli]PSL41152.1 hypothetical protein B0H99_103288 [Planomicrobium soli]